MRRDLERVVKLPEGVTAQVSEDTVTIKGNGKEAKRSFELNRVNLKVEGNAIKISSKAATRRQSRMIGTINAHLKNMVKGLNESFEYKLEICNVHFPMNVKVDGNKVVIKSFLGEKTDRIAKIVPGSEVNVKGSQITVTSHEVEKAGQTAANIEKASRLTGRDRRIFQDGIFITQKPGRII